MKPATAAILPLTRRRLFGLLAVGSAGVICQPRLSWAATAFPSGPVLGFHNDAPWLDLSGRAMPYIPPDIVSRDAPDDESLMRLGFFL